MLGQGLLQAGHPAHLCSHCQTCSRATSTWLRKHTFWVEQEINGLGKMVKVMRMGWRREKKRVLFSPLASLVSPLSFSLLLVSLTLAIALTARHGKSLPITQVSHLHPRTSSFVTVSEHVRYGCQSKAVGGRRGSAAPSADRNTPLPMLEKTASTRYLWEGQEDNQHSDVLNMQIYIWRLLEIKYFKAITLIRDFSCIFCNETQMKRITSAHCM